MKSLYIMFVVLTALFVTASIPISAASTWVDIHGVSQKSGGLGLTKLLTGNVWGSLRMDGLGSDEVRASADVLYKVPKKLWVWEPYAGGGLDYDLASGVSGAHVTVGSKLMWFFAEQEFRLVGRGMTTRGGIRLSF